MIKEPIQKKATGMKKVDLITSIILLILSGYIIFESSQMTLKDQYGPGYGFFPFWLGIILAVLSIVLLFSSLRRPDELDEPSKFPTGQGAVAVFLVILGLAGYALVLERLGYILTTFIFVAFLMGVVQRDKLKTTALTAVGVTLMLYLIFDVGLGVRLPQGPFGF